MLAVRLELIHRANVSREQSEITNAPHAVRKKENGKNY
jgi:hypothetical protein